MKLFDRVVVSSDDSHFLEFWPIVAKAWKKFFPECSVTLAFVSEEDKPSLREFGDVFWIKPNGHAPLANQGKLARFYAAGLYKNEVVTIEDLDTAPLQSKWFSDVISQRKVNSLLMVGHEVYGGVDKGKCPISTMTAEGVIFRKLFNPKALEFSALVDTFNVPKTYFNNENPFYDPSNFSDESLIRVLLEKSSIEITKAARNCNPKQDWVDRSWWSINKDKLHSGQYICCNFLRPLNKNVESIQPIVNYISE